MSIKKFQGDVRVDGNLELSSELASRALQIDGSGNIESSSVTTTELGYLSGVTSSVQTQLNAAASAGADAQVDATQALSDAADAQADIDAHIADTTGAHAASAISVTPSGNLAADDVQEALVELQGDIDSINADIAALPDPMEYKGLWNASTNSPSLVDGSGNNGDVYQVTVAGTQFTPSISFEVGDKVVYNGTTAKYEKWDMTDAVISVNGQSGIVVLDSDDIAEGASNLYFSDEKAQDATGAMVVNTDTVNLTYTDVTPELKADVKTQQSITSDGSGLKLVGDSATPGNIKYYGTDGAGAKGFYDIPAVGSAGDIQETSFSAANNQVSAANITGLAFANAVVRSFEAQVSVVIDATSDSFEVFTLSGIQKGSSWDMASSSVGDDSGVAFSITNAGQVQYTSQSSAGFVSNTIKFRASTLSV